MKVLTNPELGNKQLCVYKPQVIVATLNSSKFMKIYDPCEVTSVYLLYLVPVYT